MKIYFLDKQVPEMSNLDYVQRQFTRDGAFGLYCKDHPLAWWQARLVNGLIVLVPFAFAAGVGRIIPPLHWLAPFLVILTTVYVTQLLYQSALTERLRPYFRRYIEGHRASISQAA